MRTFFRTAVLLLAFMVMLPVAQAQTPGHTPVADAKATTASIEAYLKNLRTLKARFIQTAPDGTQTAGDFLLKRPGRMRFDYADPVTDFIVADGRFIYYYDGQMQETSNAPISQSLADFFLRSDLKLGGDVRVTDVSTAGELLTISLVQAKDESAGTLVLGFTQQPLQLKKWRIIDPQGGMTEVELFQVSEGIAIDNKVFDYYDPKRRDRGYN